LLTTLNDSYKEVNIKSEAVGYLSPCSKEINNINSINLPNNLIITSVLSDWKIERDDEALIKLGTTLSLILSRIPYAIPSSTNSVDGKRLFLNLLQKLLEDYSMKKECNTALKICTQDRLEELGDGVVPLISQDITFALPNQKLNNTKFYSNRFHVDIPKDIPIMHQALLHSVSPFMKNCEKLDRKKAIAFILDSSGSMKRNDPNNKRLSTVNRLFDFLDDNDNVYLIDFDDDAKWINDDNYTDWDIESLRRTLLEVDSEGGTNIGNALSSLQNALITTLKGSYFGGAVLLTDGKGDYNDEAIWFQEHNIPVFTVSFTGEADVNLLSMISGLTGGQFIMANSEDEAVNALEYFFNSVNCYSTFASTNTLIKQSETQSLDFSVDPGTKFLFGSLNWTNSDISVKLFNPNGTLIKGENLRKGADYLTFKVNKPKRGRWILEVVGEKVPDPGNQLNIKISGDTYYNISINPIFDSVLGLVYLNISDNQGILDRAVINSKLMIEGPNKKHFDVNNPFKNGRYSFRPNQGTGIYNFDIDFELTYRNITVNRRFYKSVQIGKNISSSTGLVIGRLGSICSTTIGKNSGNTVGLKCFVYNKNGNCKARGFVQSVNQTSCKIKIVEYFSGDKVLVGDVIKLDKEQWLNDNTR